MSKLEQLNVLLLSKDLDIPEHRRVVRPNGANLAWLSKHIGKKQDVNPQLRDLVNTPFNKLIGK